MTEDPQKNRVEKSKAPTPKKKMGSGFWITLVCFSSVWMFVFGVLVGRGTAPVQVDIQKLQNELIALKEAVLRKEKERLDTYTKDLNEKEGLDFFVELKQADGRAVPADAPTEAGTPQPSLDPKSATPVQQKPEPPTAGSTVVGADDAAVQEMPEDKKLEEKQPKTVEKKPSGTWEIQVASMQDATAADRIIQKLRQKGYAAHRFGAEIPGKGYWYRIRVGPFRDKADAETKLKSLKNDNYSTMLISP
jgi:cell division septation protein DedD